MAYNKSSRNKGNHDSDMKWGFGVILKRGKRKINYKKGEKEGDVLYCEKKKERLFFYMASFKLHDASYDFHMKNTKYKAFYELCR